jgi:hypothetical protein
MNTMGPLNSLKELTFINVRHSDHWAFSLSTTVVVSWNPLSLYCHVYVAVLR